MFKKIKDIIFSEAVRYLFIGGCTTLVNLLLFGFLCYLTPMGDSDIGITVSNVISVMAAILFAYFANKIFVFRSKTKTVKEFVFEMSKFIGARLSTMIIEVGGVWLTVSVFGQNEMIGKLETQILVLIGNYFISKFLVFKGNKKENEENAQ